MADDNEGAERTESATPKKREQARAEGRIPKSQELTTAVVLITAAALLSMVGGTALADYARRVLREAAGALTADTLTNGGAVVLLRTITSGLLVAMTPFALGVIAVGVFTNLVQSRGATSWGPVTPRLSNLNPTRGLHRLFNPDSIVQLVKAILKFVVLGTVTVAVIRGSWPELIALAQMGPETVTSVMRTLSYKLVLMTGLAFLALAAADYGWQLLRHEKSLRMTRQEIIQEHKETEGDPQIKGRIRTMQRQRARQRMLAAVPRADVVVTNPTHVAVALRYDPDEAGAPLVIAMGERKLAERIKQIAKASGVPLVENRPVARALLATCVVGKPIPPALYAAVAEILAFVYRLRRGASAAGASSAEVVA